VTAAERVYIEQQAATAGVSVTEFVRASALGRRVAVRRATADERLLLEINRIGVNLNQIAARVNFTGRLAEDFKDTLEDVQGAMADVQDAMERGLSDGS
jgi:hypothetical protein